jgi:uncharacterized membrane protein
LSRKEISVESAVPVADMMLTAPTSILGFVAFMMVGIFYLVKIFLDMNKEIFKDTLNHIKEALTNNTKAIDQLQMVVASLADELRGRSSRSRE